MRKGITVAVIFIIFIIVISLVSVFVVTLNNQNSNENSKELNAESAIINQASSLVQNCTSLGSAGNSPFLIGKALIWDLQNDSKSKIDFPLLGSSSDSPLTLFLIVDKGSEYVGQYAGTWISATQPYADIAVVYWPSMTPVGLYRVEGNPPANEINPNADNPNTSGDLNAGISGWLSSLSISTIMPISNNVNIILYVGEINNTVYGFGYSANTLTSPGPTLTFKPNDIVTITVVNVGEFDHTFVIERIRNVYEPLFNAEIGTKDNPLKPGQSGSITFTPITAGNYEYASHTQDAWGYDFSAYGEVVVSYR